MCGGGGDRQTNTHTDTYTHQYHDSAWPRGVVAPLITDPPPANSTTMHSRLVCQDKNGYLVCTAYLTGPKKAIAFEPIMTFKNPP